MRTQDRLPYASSRPFALRTASPPAARSRLAGPEWGISPDLEAEVYEDLRQLAGRCLAAEHRPWTLQATALAHEAWLRMGASEADWDSRAHFFGAAARAIRRILIDRARERLSLKRGQGQRALPLEAAEDVAVAAPGVDLLALDEALRRLAALDPDKARLIDLRFFGGLSVEETAAALGVSVSKVSRDWRFARAWLHREMGGGWS